MNGLRGQVVKFKLLLISLLLCSTPDVAFSAAGDLDAAFGVGGVITHGGVVDAVVIQPDGKILITGASYNGVDWDLFVVRFNSDGSLDTTFSENGVFMYDVGDDYGTAIVLQQDGKIVVAGGSDTSYHPPGVPPISHGVLLLRLNTDGKIDSTFGVEGIVTYKIGYFSFAYGVAIQTDGKIIVSGKAYDISYSDVLVLRYSSDGSLDASFGDNGVVTSHIGRSGNAIALQEDGKIVVVGTFYADMAPIRDLLVLRYNSDGTFDDTFGKGGIVRYDYGGYCDYCYDEFGYGVAIQPDGKIVAVGSILWNGVFAGLIVRYNSNGTLDENFGDNGAGIRPDPSGSDLLGLDVAIQADMKCVVAMTKQNYITGALDTVVFRVNANGTPDQSFNGDGYLIYDSGGDEAGRGIALQPDGKIVVTGLNSTLRLIGFEKSLVLLRPNGEEIPSGSTYSIKWVDYSGSAINFRLKYSRDRGKTWKLITPTLVTGTSYDWNVPIPGDNKKKCLIKVQGFDGLGMKVGVDKSDTPFTLEVVKVMSPSAGEMIQSGDMYSINWRTNATRSKVAYVYLYFSKNSGYTWQYIGKKSVNDGTFSKMAPKVDSLSGCKVKVMLKDAAGNTLGEDSSALFYVTTASVP